ncbi:Multidrug resistance ABC transporter ATP-binding/permease protein BmrA [Streptomyces sp. S4.7]|uniref:ABC transporter ATP-binding protein n=1 Tax=unclassified Streptomyces TaxID=2593676 RepID=UPI0011CBDECB|nr:MULTISPECIES: ABC transporter ATP-binding protein [unclassified Streptomyces]QHY99991.1 Multidrug resistance ABC transporter ATP-binding/permease protein BmrA [Streptomyces sp. S4.7]TXL89763.1 ABC transporter ATP-binding protein [Streptomyces sp. IB2014 016-6]
MNLREIVRRHQALLIIGIGMGLVGAAATLAQPWMLGQLIEAVSLDKSVVWPITFIALFFITDAAMSAGHTYVIGRAGESIVFDARRILGGRLLRSQIPHFARLEHGDIFSRTVSDTSIACLVIAQALAQMVTSVFMLVGGIVLMAMLDWLLLLATIGCLGLASVVALLLARQVRLAALKNRENVGAFGSGLQRVLGALTTVKASRAEERETEELARLAEKARHSGIRVTGFSALLTPTMNVGTQLSLAVVISWGMARVATGDMPPADLTSFVMYLFYLVSPLVMLFMSIGQAQQGRAAVQRVLELGAIPQEEEEDRQDGVPTERNAREQAATASAAVRFDKVSFGYHVDVPVLKDVSFSLPRKGLTAIVGPSGAGKTTTFQLIERFLSPDSGTIRIAGRDIAGLRLGELRSLVGYVEQDAPMMRGTIRENLTYANPSADAAEVARALRLASLDGFVAELPQGLDTDLGERGSGLSGGQRQRLAIARTLLQRPDVILLDEVTAHLDSDTEAALRDAMLEAAGECAVLAIAHRLSTIVRADRIIVMEEGRVRATGTHRELIESDEVYRRLAHQQFGAEDALI